MILSTSNNYLFLKTKKTAGTSIEIALSQKCGPNDIITPLSPEDEIKRYEATGVTAQNFCSCDFSEKKYKNAVQSKDINKLTNTHDQLKNQYNFWNHMTYEEVVSKTYQDYNIKNCFVFTIERDPADRVRSFVRYRLGNRKASRIPNVIFCLICIIVSTRPSFKNKYIYSAGDVVVADAIVRFHKMQHDLEKLASLDLIPAISNIMKTKVTKKQAHETYSYIDKLTNRVVRYLNQKEVYVVSEQQKFIKLENSCETGSK